MDGRTGFVLGRGCGIWLESHRFKRDRPDSMYSSDIPCRSERLAESAARLQVPKVEPQHRKEL